MSNCIEGQAPRGGREGGFIAYVIEMHEGHLCLRLTKNLDANLKDAGGEFSRRHLRFGTLLAGPGEPSGNTDNASGINRNVLGFVRAVFTHIGLDEPHPAAVCQAVREAQREAQEARRDRAKPEDGQ